MSAWILIPVFVAGMFAGGALVLMWANHPWTIPEGKEETMEAKTAAYWTAKGYVFQSNGECPACGFAVINVINFARGGQPPIMLDVATFETHFSTCGKAREFRTNQRMEAGIL